MKSNSSENGYFLWLKKLVEHETGYDILLLRLFDTPFYWDPNRNPLDKNRAEDGKKLRLIFCPDREKEIIFEGPSSVFEVLAGLAYRMENELLHDPEKGNRIRVWFDVMLANLGLLYFTDEAFFADGWTEEIVDAKLVKWMHRRYGRNGIGSLFTLKSGSSCQETLDIWMQMNQWIIENCIV